MDAQTTKDYLEDLIKQVTELEQQFREIQNHASKMYGLNRQLEKERDHYKALYEATL
jgi:regulator of replication initiation timing